MDEQRMIEAAQTDPGRFLDLYELHFHRVYAYVMRRCANRAETEDVVSEVFHRALANLRSYKWRGVSFAAWLLRIASNELADRWKKASRDGAEHPVEIADTDADLERRAMLFQLVERLPETQRTVIEMRFTQEKSLLEVARHLGKSEGSVKQLQRRALAGLRAAWEAGHE